MSMNLSIKNVPEQVIRRLRERAESNHRSLQDELLHILATAAEPPGGVAEVMAIVQALGLRSPSESAAIIRADRDRDSC